MFTPSWITTRSFKACLSMLWTIIFRNTRLQCSTPRWTTTCCFKACLSMIFFTATSLQCSIHQDEQQFAVLKPVYPWPFSELQAFGDLPQGEQQPTVLKPLFHCQWMIVFRATNLQCSTQNLYPNMNPILAALSLSTNDCFQGYKPSVFYPNLNNRSLFHC